MWVAFNTLLFFPFQLVPETWPAPKKEKNTKAWKEFYHTYPPGKNLTDLTVRVKTTRIIKHGAKHPRFCPLKETMGKTLREANLKARASWRVEPMARRFFFLPRRSMKSLYNWWIGNGCFQKYGLSPNHPILIGFSIMNHPFWGPTPIFGNSHIYIHIFHVFFRKSLVGVCRALRKNSNPYGLFSTPAIDDHALRQEIK